MTFRRTIELDKIAKLRVDKNQKLVDQGIEPSDGFEHQDMWIHDPFVTSCGRFAVDPISEYGQEFKSWYQRGEFWKDDDDWWPALN